MRYIVEGSLRAVGGVVRVSTQLVDATSARVLWSGRIEGRSDDTADLQDGIARGDPRLHLSRVLEAAALLQLGREPEAQAAMAAARRIRPTLTLQEVAHANGRRLAEKLGPLWA